VQVMATSGLVSALASSAIDTLLLGKRDPLEIVSRAVTAGIFGAISGAVGGGATILATKLLQGVAINTAARAGFVYMFIPFTKAFAGTLVSTVQAFADQQVAIAQGRPAPSAGEIIGGSVIIFPVNLIFEVLFMRGAIDIEFRVATQKALQQAELPATASAYIAYGGSNVFFSEFLNDLPNKAALLAYIGEDAFEGLEGTFLKNAFSDWFSFDGVFRNVWQDFIKGQAGNKVQDAAK
jgi:hypothetical protein